jgi:hypothetical protein
MKSEIDEIDRIINNKAAKTSASDKKVYGGQVKIREWSPLKTRAWNEQANKINNKIIEKYNTKYSDK